MFKKSSNENVFKIAQDTRKDNVLSGNTAGS